MVVNSTYPGAASRFSPNAKPNLKLTTSLSSIVIIIIITRHLARSIGETVDLPSHVFMIIVPTSAVPLDITMRGIRPTKTQLPPIILQQTLDSNENSPRSLLDYHGSVNVAPRSIRQHKSPRCPFGSRRKCWMRSSSFITDRLPIPPRRMIFSTLTFSALRLERNEQCQVTMDQNSQYVELHANL